MEEIQVTIIGGGVIGCAIAYELSLAKLEIFLFEKNIYLGEEQSGRNSGVIHSGIYYKDEPFKRRFCLEGNQLLYEFCEKYGIAAIKTGQFIVATDENEDKMVDYYLKNASSWGVPGVKKVFKDEIKEREPNIDAISALWSPTTGIIDAPSLLHTLTKLSKENGVEIFKQTKVVSVESKKDCFIVGIEYKQGGNEFFKTKILINAAGLYSDEIAKMITPSNSFEIVPVRGEYYKFNCSKRKEINMFGTNIYQVQESYYINGKVYKGIGIHLTPTLDLAPDGKKVIGKNVLVGPTSIPVNNKADYESNRKPAEYFFERVKKFLNGLTLEDLQIDYAGNRAKLKNENDFIIKRDIEFPNAIHLIGIDSPGLTSSLAIAKYVKEMIIKEY